MYMYIPLLGGQKVSLANEQHVHLVRVNLSDVFFLDNEKSSASLS